MTDDEFLEFMYGEDDFEQQEREHIQNDLEYHEIKYMMEHLYEIERSYYDKFDNYI